MLIQELTSKLGFEVDDHQLTHLHERLEGIHHAVGLIAGIEVVKGLYELSEKFSSMGEHLEATAVAAGLTTTELQKLQFAASQNAVSGDELAGGLARLNRQLYAAKQGGKQASAVFSKLGISHEQLMTFDNSAQALAAIQDAVSGISDANERQAITMQLFGRGSSNMIKFLLAGSKATAELGESALKMGAVVDEKGVKALAEFEDAATGLKQVFKSFMATIGAAFAPAFIEVIKLIEHSWADNIDSMRRGLELFSIRGAFWIGYLAESFRLLFVIVSSFVKDHMGLLKLLVSWAPTILAAAAAFEVFTGSINKVKQGIDALLTVKKGLGLFSDALSLLSAVGLAFIQWGVSFVALFSPQLALRILAVCDALGQMSSLRFFLLLGGWTLGIGALVVVLHDLYEMLWNGKSFKDTWMGQALSWIMKYVDPAAEKLRNFFNGTVDKVTGYRDVAKETAEFDARRNIGPMTLAQAPSLFDAASQMGMKFDPNDTSLPSNSSTKIRLDAPITINVPQGMSTRDAIRVSREGVSQGLMDMLNQAQRDVHPAAAR